MGSLSKPRKDPYCLRVLNDRQRRYVHQVMARGFTNKKEAAIAAGYSKKTAAQIACKLDKNPKIRKALQYFSDREEKKCEKSLEDLKETLWENVYYEAGEFFDFETKVLLHPTELPKEIQRLIDGMEIEITKNEITGEEKHKIKLKMSTRTAAKEQLIKINGWANEHGEDGKELKKLDWDAGLGGPDDKIEDEIEGVK